MKIKNWILLFSLLPFSLLSCNGKTEAENIAENKVLLRKAEGAYTTFHLVSAEQLRSVTRYEDAAVFVTLPNCSHCKNERVLLDEYIKKNQCIIYEVSFDIYQEAYDDTTNSVGDYAFQYPKVTGTPTYLFYKEGKLKDSHVAGFQKDAYDDFAYAIEKYVKPINLYMTNDYFTGKENDGLVEYHYLDNSENLEATKNLDLLGFSSSNLKSIISRKNSIVVLYTWRRCEDCKSLRTEVLNSYLLEHEDKKLYYYEIDGYAQLKRMQDKTYKALGLDMWSGFCDEFHLYTDVFYNTDENGSHTGYTPTLVRYENGSYSDIEVYLNEENPSLNDDSTLSYAKAFHEEVKSIKSKSKVKSLDPVTSDYQKALSELQSLAMDYDKKSAIRFLNEKL